MTDRDVLDQRGRAPRRPAEHQARHAHRRQGRLDPGAGRRRPRWRSRSAPSSRRRLLPQMADADAVVRGALAIGGFCVAALVPNLRGAERAIAAGAQKISLPVSASRLHSQSNINMTPEEAVAQVAAVVALRDALPRGPAARDRGRHLHGLRLHDGRAGFRSLGDRTRRHAGEARGRTAVNLADTTGMGNPAQVKRLFKALRLELRPQGRRGASAQHAGAGARQRGCGARCRA